MTIIRQDEFWTRESAAADRDHYYIFGDNVSRCGHGGQACVRGLDNAFGVATLNAPGEFWSDDNLESNVSVIEADIAKIPTDRPWIISQDGLGTGFAEMPVRAPLTYRYLVGRITGLESAGYICPPDCSLVLRTCTAVRTGHHEMATAFVYPERGYVEAPDWDGGKPVCGGKLHGLSRGLGDESLVIVDDTCLWQVIEIKTDDIIDLNGKVGFRSGVVIYTGTREGASALIGNGHGAHYGVATQGNDSTVTQGKRSTATQGDRSTATQGYGSTATQGDNSTATQGNWSTVTQGYDSTVTQGDYSTVTQGDSSQATQGYGSQATQGNWSQGTQGNGSVRVCTWWDGYRWRGCVAEIGDEGSFEPTPGAVRLDPGKTYLFESGKFTEVEK